VINAPAAGRVIAELITWFVVTVLVTAIAPTVLLPAVCSASTPSFADDPIVYATQLAVSNSTAAGVCVVPLRAITVLGLAAAKYAVSVIAGGLLLDQFAPSVQRLDEVPVQVLRTAAWAECVPKIKAEKPTLAKAQHRRRLTKRLECIFSLFSLRLHRCALITLSAAPARVKKKGSAAGVTQVYREPTMLHKAVERSRKRCCRSVGGRYVSAALNRATLYLLRANSAARMKPP